MKNIRNIVVAGLPGVDPLRLPPESLFYWIALPRNPVLASKDPLAGLFIKAMLSGEAARFIYIGGRTPGAPRTINVSLVFQHKPEGRIYVSGYCQERHANRIFALDLIMVIHAWN